MQISKIVGPVGIVLCIAGLGFSLADILFAFGAGLEAGFAMSIIGSTLLIACSVTKNNTPSN